MSARCWLSDNLWWSQIKIGNKNTSETCETKDSSQPVWSGRVQRPVSNLCSCSESSIFLESHQGVWSACRTEECYKALSGPDSHGTSQGGIIRGGYMDSSLGENIRQQSLGKYPDIGLMMIWIGTNWFSSALVSQACQSPFALLLSPDKGSSFRFYQNGCLIFDFPGCLPRYCISRVFALKFLFVTTAHGVAAYFWLVCWAAASCPGAKQRRQVERLFQQKRK